ncbi:hypothetical protein ACFVYF_37400 [Streptomyces sp. NPDC058274]|uniref:hypothetical protein n=1 Tax=Streptomyces sp. NPDC058274 TaxID=3346416 RepID=UPI0036EB2CA1
MPENHSHTTELRSQYIAQVAGDLERNTKEQERIGADIEALQEQLTALQHDHTVLVSMQQALTAGDAGGADLTAKPVTKAAPAVPRQASGDSKKSKPKKPVTATVKKTAARKPAAKAAKPATKPTLVELIRGHLEQQGEPRSAAEVSTSLAQSHPDRGIKTTVVRTTLEGLVAKSHAHRTKQGSSVFYSAATGAGTAAAEPQPEAATAK